MDHAAYFTWVRSFDGQTFLYTYIGGDSMRNGGDSPYRQKDFSLCDQCGFSPEVDA